MDTGFISLRICVSVCKIIEGDKFLIELSLNSIVHSANSNYFITYSYKSKLIFI